MSALVFSQNKPPKINLTELFLSKGLIWFVLLFFIIIFDEEFINWWGVTAVLRTVLIVIGFLLLVPTLFILWAKSDRVQNRRIPTLHIEADRVIFHGYRGSQLVKFDAIKRVTVYRKPDGAIASITLHQRPFHMLACQNFADMPALYAALKERLPASVSWFEPKSSGRWLVKPYQFAFFLVFIGWLFSGVLNLAFASALNLGLILLLGIQGTSQLLQQSQHASRRAKVALIVGATVIFGFLLYAVGDIPQALYHPCGLVHRGQSGCLKAYPDGENLLFLPDGQLARLSGKSIVIEPVDGGRFINLFRATRLLNDRYASNLSFSADGRTAVAGNYGTGILVWDVPAQSVTAQNIPDTSNMVLSPDGKLLGPGGPRGTITVWDTATWQPAFTLETEGHGETALGSTLLAVNMDQAIHFYDVRSGEETAVFHIEGLGDQVFVQRIVFSEDEQLLAVMTSESILLVLRRDGIDWQEMHRVQLDPSWRGDDGLAFSADNTLLATVQENYGISENRGEVLIFSVADMQLLQTLDMGRGQGQLGSVRVLDFSPDNTMLAVSSYSEGAVFELSLAK
ncbi:MAG: WD40 repeat domain-containing protein [Anaerolineales bacterium]|nr:WD40 repeat domain-containing protein [Anaerolineales bacterium]